MRFVFALAVVAVACVSAVSIGDRLHIDYSAFNALPLTTSDAISQGWQQTSDSCLAGLGLTFNYKDGPNKYRPITMYFTPAGQVAGIGVTIFGDVKQNLVDQGFFIPLASDQYHISVSFRDAHTACNASTQALPLGDRLVINQATLGLSIPLTDAGAKSELYTKGSCIKTMGYHWPRDISGSAPNFSWLAENLMPIVPMYNNGAINAFFFASTDVQQSLFPPSSRYWDNLPLTGGLMCKNWCDSNCQWQDTMTWSTLHVFLKDYTQVTCGCSSIACCDS